VAAEGGEKNGAGDPEDALGGVDTKPEGPAALPFRSGGGGGSGKR
jgi:hypothetical protein